MPSRRQTVAQRELLRKDLAEACRSGALAPGEMVPALGELTAKYGLSNGVVHQEIRRLSEEGILYTVPRVGTFVAQPAPLAPDDRDTVAILSPSILELAPNWHPSGWAKAVEQGAAHAVHGQGFHVLSLHASFYKQDRVSEAELDRLANRGLLGLILTDTGPIAECLRAGLQSRGLAIVGLDENHGLGPCDRFISDHAAGAYDATNWLLSQGRRRILNLWPAPADGYWFAPRLAGYRQAMNEAGLEPLPPLIAEYPRLDSTAAFEAAAAALAKTLSPHLTSRHPIDAIFLASDGQTPITAGALRRLNKTPNQDVLVAGYDNYWVGMSYREYDATAPALTVDKLNWELGEAAAGLLFDRINGKLPKDWQNRIIRPQVVPVLHS